MEVVRSRILGFCMGVQRAVTLASDEAEKIKEKGGRVAALGPLVHNPKVLSDLKKKGIETLSELPEKTTESSAGDCSIIIRAHGISPIKEKNLIDNGYRIIDATCPKVKVCQLKAKELARQGYFLFFAGKANHAEIEGILGYAQASNAPFCAVVGNAEEAAEAAGKLYKTEKEAKTALIGQTTISQEEYLSISRAIEFFFPKNEVIDTICSAVTDRQDALRELLQKTEAVVIAGGKESANTQRLFSIAKESGKPCVLAETAGEIPAFFYNFNILGLCAGASTPDSAINEIEMELLR